MLEKNNELKKELDRLEKGGYTGQTVLHFAKGLALIIDYPRKPNRKELKINENDNKLGMTI